MDGNTWDRVILKDNVTMEEPPISLLETMIKKNTQYNQLIRRDIAIASAQGTVIHNYFQFDDLLE
jgi:hypothetical protein